MLDDLGEPILGANVVQVGTTNGTMTDLDGNFTLSVPAGARLKVSFIGYLSQEVTAQNGMTINLAEDRKALEDVVVIGYGTAKKSDVTGSIASVSSDKLREVPAQSATQALQGRVAGVDIQRTSSRPGADQQIRIRGTRSLTASNDPLIVLDGIPFAGSIGDISPNDIKSMMMETGASSQTSSPVATRPSIPRLPVGIRTGTSRHGTPTPVSCSPVGSMYMPASAAPTTSLTSCRTIRQRISVAKNP